MAIVFTAGHRGHSVHIASIDRVEPAASAHSARWVYVRSQEGQRHPHVIEADADPSDAAGTQISFTLWLNGWLAPRALWRAGTPSRQSCVEGEWQVEALLGAHLPHDHPGGPHPQAFLDEVAEPDLAGASRPCCRVCIATSRGGGSATSSPMSPHPASATSTASGCSRSSARSAGRPTPTAQVTGFSPTDTGSAAPTAVTSASAAPTRSSRGRRERLYLPDLGAPRTGHGAGVRTRSLRKRQCP